MREDAYSCAVRQQDHQHPINTTGEIHISAQSYVYKDTCITCMSRKHTRRSKCLILFLCLCFKGEISNFKLIFLEFS